MPPKRKTKRKPPKRSKSQSQSQRQSVTINLNKTTPAKKKRSGRGRLPPPSYQQNLFPPTIIQQQAPNIAVLENQISRLTSMIQEPTGIKQPATPLSLDTRAKTAEAQRLAGEQAEARRPGPTAENFQAPPSRADDRYDNLIAEVDDLISQTPTTTQPSVTPPDQDLTDFEDTKIPTLKELAVRSLTRQFYTEGVNRVRPPDPVFSDRLVNPVDPPKRGEAGQGEGGGGLPFAESVIKRGAPIKDQSKITQGIPIGTPSAKPTKQPKAPKKETQTQKTTMLNFTKRTEQAGASL